MKRVIPAILAASLFICCLSGCGSNSSFDSSNYDTLYEESTSELEEYLEEDSILETELYQEQIDNISNALDFMTQSITVTEENGLFNLDVTASSFLNVRDFGTYVLNVKEAFENEFDTDVRGSYDITMHIGTNKANFLWFSSKNYSEGQTDLVGTLYDSRSGEIITTAINGRESLFEMFPAAEIADSKSQLDEADVAIYEEVMDALNADFDRPEDEILAELAPQYDMTVDELRQFMRDMMEQIY